MVESCRPLAATARHIQVAIKGHDIVSTTSLSGSLSHTHAHHNVTMKDDTVAGSSLQLFTKSKVSCYECCLSHCFTTDDTWARTCIWHEGQRTDYCIMPVIQCIACHLSPASCKTYVRTLWNRK